MDNHNNKEWEDNFECFLRKKNYKSYSGIYWEILWWL